MMDLWSDESRFKTWYEVELAACQAMEAAGQVPEGTSKAVEKAVTKIDAEKIAEIEAETKHDVIAFLTHVQEQAGEPGRYLHLGMTSSDVLDTAFALRLKRAGQLILKQLDQLRAAIHKQAMKHRRTMTVGRTHGVHAQPVTLGLIFAVWYEETYRARKRIRQAIKDVAVGKLSGAVGTYRYLNPAIEEDAVARLRLVSAAVSNQIIQRDRHAWFFASLAVLSGSIEKMALTIRLWQQTEVAEAFEPFGKKQKGSSAMPHKRNPILTENVCGISRLIRAYADASMENIALWHERDISHSSVERVIGPDATTAMHFMLRRMTRVIDGLVVDKERMKKNLELSGGTIYSEGVLLALTTSGLGRQEAYEHVQKAAMEASKGKESFAELLEKNEVV
ncbi:MAG: adenylosuccinate lyase, partial [Deltaproteobacteria bacterium]|nr:adenylosuccinate lyase [Deltaproteobacteria bacterium]